MIKNAKTAIIICDRRDNEIVMKMSRYRTHEYDPRH